MNDEFEPLAGTESADINWLGGFAAVLVLLFVYCLAD